VAAYDAILADFDAIHDGRIDADKTVIADIGAVDSAVVSDGTIVSDDGGRVVTNMNHYEVLNVGAASNSNFQHLSAHHHIGPNSRLGANSYLSEEQRRVVNERWIIENDVGAGKWHVLIPW